jgi:hypothetical protein
VLKYFSDTLPENFGGAENSTENSGPHAGIFSCYMYELSQQHPVWVAEINVTACNSVVSLGKALTCKRYCRHEKLPRG